MKKTFKRAGVAVLSMAMLLSMGAIASISASAYEDGKGGLKIESSTGILASSSLTINAYKVASVTSGHWGWDSDLPNSTATAADLSKLTSGSATATEVKTIADKLATISDLATKCDTVTGITIGTEKTDVPAGYYLIIATDTSAADTLIQPMLKEVKAGEKATISDVKATKIEMDKRITAVSNGSILNSSTDSDIATISNASTVDYQLKTTLPIYAETVSTFDDGKHFTITDTYDPALTLTSNSIEVYIDKNGTSGPDNDDKITTGYTLSEDTTNHKFTITFDDATVVNAANRGKDVYVKFQATFNQPATPNTNYDYDNTAKLTFDNTYNATAPTAKELTDDADVYSVPVKVYKYYKDSGNNEIAITTGATFRLTDNANASSYQELTTDSNGYAKFSSLKAGTYKLTETAAPHGYKKIDGTIKYVKIEVSATDGTVTVSESTNNTNWTPMTAETDKYFQEKVQNTPTEELPGTGGMGTVLFTVGGAAIVLLAGVLFVVYMRKRKVEE